MIHKSNIATNLYFELREKGLINPLSLIEDFPLCDFSTCNSMCMREQMMCEFMFYGHFNKNR